MAVEIWMQESSVVLLPSWVSLTQSSLLLVVIYLFAKAVYLLSSDLKLVQFLRDENRSKKREKGLEVKGWPCINYLLCCELDPFWLIFLMLVWQFNTKCIQGWGICRTFVDLLDSTDTVVCWGFHASIICCCIPSFVLCWTFWLDDFILFSPGFKLSTPPLSSLVLRYANRKGNISFDDFLQICCRIRSCFGKQRIYLVRHRVFGIR